MKEPPPREARCENCAFWKAEEDGAGECRRNPPTVLYDVEDGLFCTWPATDLNDWCGEHRPRKH